MERDEILQNKLRLGGASQALANQARINQTPLSRSRMGINDANMYGVLRNSDNYISNNKPIKQDLSQEKPQQVGNNPAQRYISNNVLPINELPIANSLDKLRNSYKSLGYNQEAVIPQANESYLGAVGNRLNEVGSRFGNNYNKYGLVGGAISDLYNLGKLSAEGLGNIAGSANIGGLYGLGREITRGAVGNEGAAAIERFGRGAVDNLSNFFSGSQQQPSPVNAQLPANTQNKRQQTRPVTTTATTTTQPQAPVTTTQPVTNKPSAANKTSNGLYRVDLGNGNFVESRNQQGINRIQKSLDNVGGDVNRLGESLQTVPAYSGYSPSAPTDKYSAIMNAVRNGDVSASDALDIYNREMSSDKSSRALQSGDRVAYLDNQIENAIASNNPELVKQLSEARNSELGYRSGAQQRQTQAQIEQLRQDLANGDQSAYDKLVSLGVIQPQYKTITNTRKSGLEDISNQQVVDPSASAKSRKSNAIYQSAMANLQKIAELSRTNPSQAEEARKVFEGELSKAIAAMGS